MCLCVYVRVSLYVCGLRFNAILSHFEAEHLKLTQFLRSNPSPGFSFFDFFPRAPGVLTGVDKLKYGAAQAQHPTPSPHSESR